MEPQGVKRKLTAILSADVAGYSRLMGEDEEATLKTLTAYREVIAGLVTRHRGRVVDMTGDSVLAEFASVVDAVRCAVQIEQELGERNAVLPEERRMHFRIGVNLGDVMIEGDHVFGDGVNVAARLEGLADPGGICLSRPVYDQVKNRVALGYEYLGEQEVKNIAEPVRVYRVLLEPVPVGTASIAKKGAPRRWQWRAWAVVGVVLAGAAAVAVWSAYRPSSLPLPVVAFDEGAALALPDKPSIAVLPFTNLSGDPEQEYFSDGITNDIITDLAKFPNLFVIASNSAFTYKGKPAKVQEVGRELGVRYVLEGSVQRAGDRMRINAQLIDAATGRHLWAERYDRDLNDLFGVQDEILKTIVATLAVKVDAVERERAMRKDTDSLEAYDYYLRGSDLWFDFTKEANAQAGQMFEKAIELDPEFARAYAFLAWVHRNDYRWGWAASPDESLALALELAHKANALEPSDHQSHWTLGAVYLDQRRYEQALAEYERALALNPNDADFLAEMAAALVYVGRAEEGIAQIVHAMRLNPFYPDWYPWILGSAYYHSGQCERSLAALKKMNNPTYLASRTLAVTYVCLRRIEEARTEIAKLLKNEPDYTLENEKSSPFKNQADLDRYLDDLRTAGLPERG